MPYLDFPLDGLANPDFKVDHEPDGASRFFKCFRHGGGYYINVGASELIAEDKLRVKQGQEIDQILPRDIQLSDDSKLEADEVVFATG